MTTSVADTPSPTYLETLRQNIGLSRFEFLRAIGHSDPAILLPHHASKNPEVLANAAALEHAYAGFHALCRQRLDEAFENHSVAIDGGPKLISSIELGRAIGLGEFAIANLRSRGKLKCRHIGRMAYYDRESIERLFNWHLDPNASIHRNILAQSFLEYIGQRAS